MEGKHLVKRGGWLLGPALFLLMINMDAAIIKNDMNSWGGQLLQSMVHFW